MAEKLDIMLKEVKKLLEEYDLDHMQQKLQEAQEICNDIFKEHKNNSDAFFYLGCIEYYRENMPAAIYAFQSAIDFDYKNPKAYFNLGLIESKNNGKKYTAIKYFKKAEEFGYDFARIGSEIENAEYNTNDNNKDEVIYVSKYLIEKNKAKSFYDKKEYDNAIEYCKKALNYYTKDSETYFYLGNSYYEKENYEKSKEYLEKACKLNPNKEEYLYWCGRVYCNIKQYEEAIILLKKACKLNPDNEDNFYWCGKAYYDNEQYKEAVDYLKKACKLEPNDIYNQYWLGLSYYKNEQYEDAIEHLKKACELNPDNEDNFYWCGKAYYDNEQYEEAVDYLKKSCELNPDDDEIYFYWCGMAYYNNEQYEEAIKYLKKACELKPEDIYNQYWCGSAYYDNQQHIEALYHLRKTCEIKPNNNDEEELVRNAKEDIESLINANNKECSELKIKLEKLKKKYDKLAKKFTELKSQNKNISDENNEDTKKHLIKQIREKDNKIETLEEELDKIKEQLSRVDEKHNKILEENQKLKQQRIQNLRDIKSKLETDASFKEKLKRTILSDKTTTNLIIRKLNLKEEIVMEIAARQDLREREAEVNRRLLESFFSNNKDEKQYEEQSEKIFNINGLENFKQDFLEKIKKPFVVLNDKEELNKWIELIEKNCNDKIPRCEVVPEFDWTNFKDWFGEFKNRKFIKSRTNIAGLYAALKKDSAMAGVIIFDDFNRILPDIFEEFIKEIENKKRYICTVENIIQEEDEIFKEIEMLPNLKMIFIKSQSDMAFDIPESMKKYEVLNA